MGEILNFKQNDTTYETRKESYDSIVETLGERQKNVMKALKEMGTSVTAKELAVFMFETGTSLSQERNATHPRLNELVEKELVKVHGKRICQFTGKRVSVYELDC
ncbi:MAG: hypothetical protein ACRC4N_16025 [Gammaproteobacteria bacterium]